MRVLLFAPHYMSFPGTGSPMRMYCLARELARRGHRLQLVAARFYGEPDARCDTEGVCEGFMDLRWQAAPRPRGRWSRLAARARRVVGATPHEVRRLEVLREPARQAVGQALESFRPDLAWVEHPLAAALLDGVEGLPPLVVGVHDLVHRLHERAAAVAATARDRVKWTLEAARMKAYETRLFQRPWHFLACSGHDREALLALAPGARVNVVPNGVDVDYFRCEVPGDPVRLVYTGNMASMPNQDAARFFVGQVLGRIRQVRPEVRLDIVGMGAGEEVRALGREPGVTVTGAVDDVRPCIAAAGIFVVPLRVGSGTRLKILEAMAMGRPVVSTRVGAEGLDLADGEDAFLADEPEEMARRVLSLMGDEGLRRRLGERGRRLVEERFSWAVLGPAMERACLEAAGCPAPR